MARHRHAVAGRPAGRLAGTVALAALPLAALLLFFLYPVAGMVGRGFAPDGQLDVGAVLDVLGRPRVHRVLWFTLWSAAAGTVVALALGLPTAYVLHRLRFPGRDVLRALVVVPFVLPTVVVGVAFRQLIAPSGPLGPLGLDGSAVAIVAALAFFNVSVVVRTVGAFWESLDPRREEAAAALGASPWQVLRTVTLPALRPGIVSAASVVFLFCATAFGVVLTMGGLRYANVETEIYLLTTQELDLTGAAALSVLQVLVVTGLLLVSARTRRTAGPLARSTRPLPRPGVRHLPVLAWTTATLVFLMSPLVSLVLASLRGAPTAAGGTSWGLDSYRALTTTGEGNALLVPVTHALRTSLTTAVVAASLALLLGSLVAFLVSRPGGGRLGSLLDGAFMLPLGVSAVTVGFGFLVTLDRPPLDLRSSSLLVPVAQAMVALPLVVRTVAPVLRSVDDRQRQAAASLGAGPLRVLTAVDLPVAWRALLAAAGFAFAVSLGEFGATAFLARDDDPTLPVVIYRLIGQPGAENFGMAMAASVVLAAATTAVVLGVQRLRVGSAGAF
ncbi:thiamine transport system permease protein [Nocardioides scoriae]|uniref:Thiamine transport system permease protein n=1 Tax=Nocardioides scoriae TaxID=642780 RepID=A0A1H1U3D1_9ACTN|nr:iron ABC transporter permease [Nocardioides scoriae]SDS66726.1 thiamine transport system permease protein [Nocardioides scoriae]